MYRLLIPALSIAVLAGLVLLAQLLSTFHSVSLSPTRELITAISSSPLRWSYALGSGIAFISFLLWLPFKLPEWWLLRRYQHVDSAILDNDCELCMRFYQTLLGLHMRYGEERFMQRIASRFNFFYHYHTEALHWINKIVRDVDADSIPVGMMTHTICAGHTGRVFTRGRYGGGLPSAFVKLNEAIYLLAWMDSVEVWSASSSTPICIFERDSLELNEEYQQPHFASVRLHGLEKSTQKHRHLEMRLYEVTTPQHLSAQNQLDAFRKWLNELVPTTDMRTEENFGIDVAEIDEPQPSATEPRQDKTSLAELLNKLLGTHIDAVFSHDTLSISDPQLSRSTIVLCSGLGIVLIEDIPLAGTIRYSGETQWLHTTSDGTDMISNACLDMQHTKHTLINHLDEVDLNRWPVYELVVFSHQDVQPELELSRQQVQCDVITLGQLPKWFASQTVDDRIRFTKNDYNEFITLLDPARLRKHIARHA